jgi:hypothetical protein
MFLYFDMDEYEEEINISFSDFDLHEYRHYYLAENWKISKRVRKTHQLSPSKYHPIKKFSNSFSFSSCF